MLLGKLEIRLYTFTALGNTEEEVSAAILKAWTKFCKVEKKPTYGKHFKSEAALKEAIHYLQMDVGIAYRLYNKVPPMEKDLIKNLTVAEDEKDKTEEKIRKQVVKKMIEGLLNELTD